MKKENETMTKPIHFLHITDTHLNKPTIKQKFLNDPVHNLQRVFDDVYNFETKISFIVISGDLVHEGDEEDYRFIRRFLDEQSERLGVPIYVGLGNHDHRSSFRVGYLNEVP